MVVHRHTHRAEQPEGRRTSQEAERHEGRTDQLGVSRDVAEKNRKWQTNKGDIGFCKAFDVVEFIGAVVDHHDTRHNAQNRPSNLHRNVRGWAGLE